MAAQQARVVAWIITIVERILIEPDVRVVGREPSRGARFVVETEVRIEDRAFEISEIVPVVLRPVGEIDDGVSSGKVVVRIQPQPRLRDRLLAETRKRGHSSLCHLKYTSGDQE